MRLEKWQRNAIFEAIQSRGLDPIEFDLDLGEGEAEARITHRWSESLFVLGGEPGHYRGSYAAGEAGPLPYEVFTWDGAVDRVRVWIDDVKRDLETPDLWAELQRQREILGGIADDTENTPLTPDEQAEITSQLRRIEEYVQKTYSLTQGQKLALKAGFEDVKADVKRLGRIDLRWRILGFIFTLFVAGILPPEAMHHILVLALQALGQLFGGGVPYLPPELPPPVA